ncbi:hypothetical protein BDAP_000865 [Binucleata daphniae]
MEKIKEQHVATDIATDANKKAKPYTEKLFLKNYNIIRILGEGTYGKVKLAFDYINKRLVALKFVKKADLKKPGQLDRVRFEAKIMSIYDHPALCRLYKAIETIEYIILELEYIKGQELFDYITKMNTINENDAKKIFGQILDGVAYMHQHRTIHRDLKPENIIITTLGEIKIVDFGFASIYRLDSFCTTHCGSSYYAAPEMVLAKRYIGPEVDIWSLGIILYAMIHGKLPFEGKDVNELYANIVKGKFFVKANITKSLADLLNRMICLESKYRATLYEVFSHPWMMKKMHYENFYPILTCDNRILFKLIDFKFTLENIRTNINNIHSPEACFYRMISKKITLGNDINTIGVILTESEYYKKMNFSIKYKQNASQMNIQQSEKKSFRSYEVNNDHKTIKKQKTTVLIPQKYVETIKLSVADIKLILLNLIKNNNFKCYRFSNHFQILTENKESVLFDIYLASKDVNETHLKFLHISGNPTKFSEIAKYILGYLYHLE